MDATTGHNFEVAIIGAGFSGIGMACRLLERGIDEIVVIERAHEVGGTWRDNVYPGAACDIPSDLYSFSFAPNPDWTHRYPSQPELLAYLHDVADRFGVTPKIRFGTELERASWSDADSEWHLSTSTGELSAKVLVSGAGPFVDPVWPDIPGLESFTGERVHSATWHPVETEGRSVAVIGTGASAIQLIPELQKTSGSLTVFQRTPAWVIPRGDRETSARRRTLFRRHPALQRVARTVEFLGAEGKFPAFASPLIGRVGGALYGLFRRAQVPDREVRARLTPRYRIGCKRVLISSTFYPAMSQPNVTLVTNGIREIDGGEVVTVDGTRHRVDVLVCATGFNVTEPPIAHVIHGRDGAALSDLWSPHMGALRGTTVAGCPNLFLLIGPNTVLSHNSMVYMIEAQIDYVLQSLAALRAGGYATLDARPEAQAAYNAGLQRDMSRSVSMVGGCASYYVDAGGRNTSLWPHTATKFAGTVRRFEPSEYVLS
jgi:cation diffusion facilitator CzcD-associated flavoprotein CzcO